MGPGQLRLEKLDGLRGVAAFAVLLFHITPGGTIQLVQHAGLAVDFFFLLSGFVIAAAYEKRLAAGMTFRTFVYLRLVRLYPLIALAVLLGAVGYVKLYDPATMSILIATGLLLIPTPLGSAGEGQPAMALNPPSWSLFWEIAVNCLFALVSPRLSNRMLAILLVAALAAVAASARHGNTLNIGAFWFDFWGGGPRVLFSFFAGLALFRLWRHRGGFGFSIPVVASSILLCIIISVPELGQWNWLYDVAAVAVLFPLLLMASCSGDTGRLSAPCRFLGDLSYPMYVLQSGITPHLRGLPGHLDIGGWPALWLGVALAVGFCVFAWVVLDWYDKPVRAWLSRRLMLVPARPAAATAP